MVRKHDGEIQTNSNITQKSDSTVSLIQLELILSLRLLLETIFLDYARPVILLPLGKFDSHSSPIPY
jgi:hypothetical protein